MKQSRGIQTNFRGTNFRSRLEARWAHLFDEIGWHWEYEPFDCDGWIPDFLILGDKPMLVEIKPLSRLSELITVAEAKSVRCPSEFDLLALGCVLIPHDERCGMDINRAAGAMAEWCAGWETESLPSGQLLDGMEDGWAVATANWHTCGKCGSVAVHHDEQSYAGRPCGHWDGDHYLGWLDLPSLEARWATARNVTQWKAKGGRSKDPPRKDLVTSIQKVFDTSVSDQMAFERIRLILASEEDSPQRREALTLAASLLDLPVTVVLELT